MAESDHARAQVQGALKLQCQNAHKLHGEYKAVAIIVEGGSVSRVEAYCMSEIVRCVKVFGEDGAPVDCDIAIVRYTQAELFAEWAPYVGQPSVRRVLPAALKLEALSAFTANLRDNVRSVDAPEPAGPPPTHLTAT